jgi:hypothetical protein
MFGMVLAIGIIVDDAIVVVENVERLMEEKSLLRATLPASHGQITPAIIGITLVLTAVFIPMGLLKVRRHYLSTILYFHGGIHTVVRISCPDADACPVRNVA